jgi:phosphoglycolate phosphatase-like HAD superfamily hydrolase
MKIFIVDIDGTLADCSHRLHFISNEPKNWNAFFNACKDDEPIRNVVEVVRAVGLFRHYGESSIESADIVYLTGRPERVRYETQSWLARYFLPSGTLVMRMDGDHRPDTIAKRELLEGLIARGNVVLGVFEDRPSVCRVWREMGLTVFQLSDKEF